TGVQMHGDESPVAVYACLPYARRNGMRKIKTIQVKSGQELWLDHVGGSEVVDTWLLDSGAGSGQTFDWQSARKQIGDRQGQFVIAGGLTPENVGDAIRIFKPWGVDVVTGVEREPGRKDPEKLKAFVAAVRRAEQA
ncbi:MAG: phosphoribosylanthranilate isomerase, partial [Candidatus Angelobacter sp.]